MPMLYFDCFSGISGDMTIGALLDLGLELGYLQAELQKLPLTGYRIEASRVVRANISAMKFDVRLDDGTNPPTEGHSHAHGAHHSSGYHCKAADILSMIRTSGLNANTSRMAEAIFTKLAISEGRVHRIPP